ncbi:MAG: class I SAM-dependent methyltransferase [Bacteroidota bacterium]
MSQLEVNNDPMGAAILDYAKSKKPADIIVCADLCEDDIIPVEVLFRTYDEMPELEKMALDECGNSVLDVGAGAGVHAKVLMGREHQVTAIDISKGVNDYLATQGIECTRTAFLDFKGQKFDTVLMLMNGIGIAGKLADLETYLLHAKSLLNEGGNIIFDSSDVKFLYEDEDGSYWMDLNAAYYGNFRFQMHYKKEKSEWFDWLYVDFDSMYKIAKKVGLKAKRIYENDDNYLAVLTVA